MQEDRWQAALLTCTQAGCSPRDHRAGGWLAGSPPYLYSGWLPPPGPPCRRMAGRPPSLPVLRLAATLGTTVQEDGWQGRPPYLFSGWLPPPGPPCRRMAGRLPSLPVLRLAAAPGPPCRRMAGRPPSLPVIRLAAAPGTTVQDDPWQAALLTCTQAGCRPRDHRAGGWLAGRPPYLY